MAPLPIGVIGERADLTYDYEYLGAGPETLADVIAGRHSFADKLKAREAPADHRRAGRSRPPRRPRRPRRSRRRLARDVGAVKEGWNGF